MSSDGARNIKVFAWVSLLNDVASEATTRLLPLFLSTTLGAGPTAIGLIEGVAESTATLTRLASGWLSDRLRARKPFVVAGYALSGLTKPVLLVAGHWTVVLAVRFFDRLGKGIRAAPRDALAADSAAAGRTGRAFGLMASFDTMGAFLGLSFAFVAVYRGGATLSRGTFNGVVLFALVPAFAAVALAWFGVRERMPSSAEARAAATPESAPLSSLKTLPTSFWRYLALLGLFTLSNSSDAFLILKAARLPAPASLPRLAGAPFALLCLLALNASQALLAAPAGHLSDRIGRRGLIAAGWFVYAATYAGFALAEGAPALLSLFVIYGVFYGLTEGVQRSYVADLVPSGRNRGLAYGVFSFVGGAFALPASLLFGLVATHFGDSIGFAADAALAAVAGLGLLVLKF